MKPIRSSFVLAAAIFFSPALRSQVGSQPIDSTLAAKITVSGFCLCRTTFGDLQRTDSNLAEVDVEEMDLGKRCSGIQDSRYINGKGYYSRSFPGMIFQKDDEDFISKIRLTRGFKGKLPDGAPIDMDSLLLKDVMKRYPWLESKWGSRDCSDYWSFSNDTVAFYVRIDTSKHPQYPIDEAYYMNKPVAGIDVLMSCYEIYHKSETISLFGPDDPMYFLDSIRVNMGVLKNYTPEEIAFLKVYRGKDAIAVAGKEATNGAIYFITKKFAREHYSDYFRSRSAEYSSRVPDMESEAGVGYILNGKVLKKNPESDLFLINDNNFIDLHVIDSDTLRKKYHVRDKTIGVVIRTR